LITGFIETASTNFHHDSSIVSGQINVGSDVAVSSPSDIVGSSLNFSFSGNFTRSETLIVRGPDTMSGPGATWPIVWGSIALFILLLLAILILLFLWRRHDSSVESVAQEELETENVDSSAEIVLEWQPELEGEGALSEYNHDHSDALFDQAVGIDAIEETFLIDED
jgi:hypothetical protein